MSQPYEMHSFTPEWAVLESGELEGSEVEDLLESLTRFPAESYRARFWTSEEEGFVSVQRGRIDNTVFSGQDGPPALDSIKSLPLCRYRITRR